MTTMKSSEYYAFVRKEGRHHLVEFPDAPGCQTFSANRADAVAAGKEAIEGWLEAHLVDGRVPPVPRAPRPPRPGETRLRVLVSPRLAVAVQIRRMRQARGLTQAELAKRVGVSQQQIAKVEDPDANPTLLTLIRIADALDRTLVVAFRDSA
jgi:DNA-binding XRE family transcriptional regulator/predicted RNase H-like HicB family nuclease